MKKRNTILWGLTLLGCLFGAQAFAQLNVNHPASGNAGTFSIAPPGTCSINYYDNGGPGGAYSTSISNSTVTFAPSAAGKKIRCTFSSYSTEASFDFLTVYDGPTTGSPFIASTSGTVPPTNMPGNIVQATAGNASGQLTFSFFSDFIVTSTGWAAVITQVDLAACAIIAPANQIVSTGAADCSATITTALPLFNPGGCQSAFQLQYKLNGGAAVVIPQPLPGTITIANIPKGANVITWQLVDPCGGVVISSATQTVTVVDQTPPTINCPANMTINLAPGACSQIVSYNVTATDNCPLVVNTANWSFPTPDTTSTPIFNLSLSCSFGTPFIAVQNNYFQVLTGFAQNTPVKYIRVAISTAYANQGSTLIGRLYTMTNTAQPYNLASTNRVLLATTNSTPVPVGSAGQKINLNFPVSATVPAGSTIVMEVQTDFPFTIGMGASNGQRTWLGSDLCGIPVANPSTMCQIGFCDEDMIATLYGQAAAPPPVQTAGLPSGSEFPIGTTTNCFKAVDVAGNTSTCCFTVTVKDYPNPVQTLVCNDLVYVSLDKDCTEALNADQILEGGPYSCYANYIVQIDKTPPYGNGPWVPAVLGPSDVGKTYAVQVIDPKTGNKCWGNLKVEDKLAPVLVCKNASVPCNSSASPTASPVTSDAVYPKNFAIADAAVTTVNFSVAPGSVVNDINVVFKTNHTWVGDISAKLKSPSGTEIQLFNRPGNGNCAGDGMDVIFDDAATNTAQQFVNTCGNNPAIAGTFKPADPLSTFNGQPTGGTWTLTVQDFVGGDAGPNSFASLNINSTTTPPGFPNGLVYGVNVFPGSNGTEFIVPAGVGTPALENCSDVTLTYQDQEFAKDCASGLSKTVNRKWTAKDASGNTKTCIQVINFFLPSHSPPGPITQLGLVAPEFQIVNASTAGPRLPTPRAAPSVRSICRADQFSAAFSLMKAISTMMPPHSGTRPIGARVPASRAKPLMSCPRSTVASATTATTSASPLRTDPGPSPAARAQPVNTAEPA